MKNRALSTGLIAPAIAFVSALVIAPIHPAHAGETLRLKSGTVSAAELAALRERVNLTSKKDKTERYYVIQFKSKISRGLQQIVLSQKVKVVRYLPDDALVVRATTRAIATIEKSSTSIQVVAPYQPAWKISPEFEPASVFSAKQEHQVLIRLFPLEDGKSVVDKLQDLRDVKIDSPSGRSIVATVSRAQIERIAEIEGVEWIQINPKFELTHVPAERLAPVGGSSTTATKSFSGYVSGAKSNHAKSNDLTGFEDGTKLMNFDAAWSRGVNGDGQIIALSDTGLDRGDSASIHQDFAGRVSNGFFYGLFSKSWEDQMGHGTHVAGSIAGAGAASGGRIKGGAPGAQLIPQSLWSPMLNTVTVPSKLRDVFSKAYESGARIHSNSWGSSSNLGAYDGYAQQVDEFAFSNPDMLMVFSAGNGGVDADRDGRVDAGSISSPATAKNVLTVGASKNYVLKGGIQGKLKDLKAGSENWSAEPLASSGLSENAMGLAPFSSRGPTQDGRLKPEVVAPGTNILSVRSRHPGADVLWGAYSDDYVYSGGTSMATPLVAGAAAVVRQYLIDNRKVAQPSAALIKAVLVHTAFDLFPGQFGEIGEKRGQEILNRRPNIDEGYGRVDLSKATDLAKALIVDDHSGLAMGEAHAYQIRVSGKSKLVATLVYTDAPAAAGAAIALVNDLDLVIVDSKGKETSLNDRLNNSEMIEVDVPAGDYEVRVKATNVPQGLSGRQPYALVLSLK